MAASRSTYLWGGTALLAGAVLRAAFVAKHARFGGDALTYGDLAHNMLAHHVFGFTENVIRPTLIRLPGYPLFLAACFVFFGNANYLAVLWMQVVVDLASCVLLGVLAARLFGRRAGWIALWLAVLCPFTANYAAAPLTETLSIFCVVLAFFALERWAVAWRTDAPMLRWACVTGLTLAYAVLLRPDQGLLAASVVPAMLWISLREGRQMLVCRLQPTLVASMIVVLPLLLWAGRNWRVFHVVQPLAPRYANDPGESVLFGFQRWYRTWAVDFKSTVDVYWSYDGSTLQMQDLPARAFDSPAQRVETAAIYAQYNVETTSTPALDQAFSKLAADRVADDPLRYYVLLPVARVLNMWLRPRTELMKLPIDWWAVRLHPRRSVAEMAYALWNAAYLVLGLLGVVQLWRCGRRLNAASVAAMVGFVVLRCLLLLTLDNSEPRYTLECFPVVMLLASFALTRAEAFSAKFWSRSC